MATKGLANVENGAANDCGAISGQVGTSGQWTVGGGPVDVEIGSANSLSLNLRVIFPY
jgi:hypothetical protein